MQKWTKEENQGYCYHCKRRNKWYRQVAKDSSTAATVIAPGPADAIDTTAATSTSCSTAATVQATCNARNGSDARATSDEIFFTI